MSRIFDALQNARHDVAEKLESADEVPRVTVRSSRTKRRTQNDDNRYFVLYEKLRALSPRHDGFLMALMGPNGGEGTSTISQEFGDFLSRQTDDRILILECLPETKLRKPRTPDDMSVRCLDALEAQLADAASRKGNGSLVLSAQLPGGTQARGEAWSKDELDRFLNALTSLYEWVVLDCAPVFHPENAGRLARIADATVLVVESEGSEVNNVIEASKRLKLLDANLLGVVLNKRSNYIPSLLRRVIGKLGGD